MLKPAQPGTRWSTVTAAGTAISRPMVRATVDYNHRRYQPTIDYEGFGYAAGMLWFAIVGLKTSCIDQGSGTFTQSIERNATVDRVIPAGEESKDTTAQIRTWIFSSLMTQCPS